MAQNKKTIAKRRRQTLLEFLRLNIAGFVFFWSTYGLFFLFDKVLRWEEWIALAIASLLAHGIFFYLDKKWVFTDNAKQRKTHQELTRFFILMTINYFLNLGIVLGLSQFGISPYLGQFAGPFFFTFWNYFWFKWWVFKAPQGVKSGSGQKATN